MQQHTQFVLTDLSAMIGEVLGGEKARLCNSTCCNM